MEAKLAKYRAEKEKQQNSRYQTVVSWIFRRRPEDNSQSNVEGSVNKPPVQPSSERRAVLVQQPPRDIASQPIYKTELSEPNWRDYIPLGLKICLWLCLWKFFIEVGFGAVYFVVSCSYLMYRNTRTHPRGRGELSAYSVFNPNQERLDGTFTAEQFEKELRMGSGSVR